MIPNMHFECWEITFIQQKLLCTGRWHITEGFLVAGFAVTYTKWKQVWRRLSLLLNSTIFLTGCLTLPAQSLLGKTGFTFFYLVA